ncbi:hypothetical protein WAF17_09910 [Bernardetia sp. ABR2-2B]|uniref:hypothetical protein n=1 Tax=Bernardetia sp. ABR2-2B TaxID=3127472 RepID=UPI0030D12A68
MNTNQIIKSKEENSWTEILLVFGFLILGGIGFLSIGYYIFSFSLASEYADIPSIVLGGFFAIMGVLCIVVPILSLEELELDNEKLVVKSIFGYSKKIILLEDIVRYAELEQNQEDDKDRVFVLTIYTKTKKCFLTTQMSNYEQFKHILTQNAKDDSEAQKRVVDNPQKKFTAYVHLIGGALMMIIGLGLCYVVMTNWTGEPILNEQITNIKGTLVEDIEIDSDANGNESIKILLQEYPKFSFSVASIAATSSKVETGLKKGDVITLGILNDEYLKKFTKTKSLEFWDKYINYKVINVYRIQANNKKYLALDNLNKESKKDIKYKWVGYLIGFGLALYGVFGLIKYRNQYNQINM